MIVIPAIGLKGGRCVRLCQGGMQGETVYSQDPGEVARRWEDEGAQLLHVVDLNGAVEGTPRNRKAIEAILKAASIPVQVGGGIRTMETVSAYLSSGGERVVLGTAVVRERAVLEEACSRVPGRVLVGVGAQGGKGAGKGWAEGADQEAADFVGRLTGLAVYAVIYTDIARDGMLEGPNLEA